MKGIEMRSGLCGCLFLFVLASMFSYFCLTGVLIRTRREGVFKLKFDVCDQYHCLNLHGRARQITTRFRMKKAAAPNAIPVQANARARTYDLLVTINLAPFSSLLIRTVKVRKFYLILYITG